MKMLRAVIISIFFIGTFTWFSVASARCRPPIDTIDGTGCGGTGTGSGYTSIPNMYRE